MPHEPGRLIRTLLEFKNHLVRLERIAGLPRIIVRHVDTGAEYPIEFSEDVYELGLIPGYEFETDILRFTYSSMTTPSQTYDFNILDQSRDLRQEQEVPSGHDPAAYITRRLSATSHDGVDVPISLLYHKDAPLDGSAPVLLYGYGSYGMSMPASFSTNRYSLVDRGYIYAIAHVRGGTEKGYGWYLDGKLQKQNTFLDFIAAADHMIEEKSYTTRSDRHSRRQRRRYARGRLCQYAPQSLGCRGRRGSLCRCTHHHVRYRFTSDAAGMAGMGKSNRKRRSIQLYQVVFPGG